MFATLAGNVAAAQDPSKPVAGMVTVLSYNQMAKTMQQAKETVRMQQALIGRQVQLKLRASGPELFMVNGGDGVFFHCEKQARPFKGGLVKSTIRNIEDTAEGDFMITLANCE